MKTRQFILAVLIISFCLYSIQTPVLVLYDCLTNKTGTPFHLISSALSICFIFYLSWIGSKYLTKAVGKVDEEKILNEAIKRLKEDLVNHMELNEKYERRHQEDEELIARLKSICIVSGYKFD